MGQDNMVQFCSMQRCRSQYPKGMVMISYLGKKRHEKGLEGYEVIMTRLRMCEKG